MSARLYCAGFGERLRFCTADTKAVASDILGVLARKPTDDELRVYWEAHGFDALEPTEAARQVGVSRQTIWLWRRRVGAARG